ncbi:MAG: sialidase family protein [Thermoplasmatota archaeon]
MRVLLLATVLVLAGCIGAPTKATIGAVPSPAFGGWTLDCALGSFEKAMNATWGQTCEARASHTKGPKEETWLAINPKDPLNIVIGAKDLNPDSSKQCVWNGVFTTHDGGKTWKDVVIGGTYASRQGDPTNPFFGYACNTDPDFQFTANGDLHYGVEEYNLGGQNAYGATPVTPLSPTLGAASIIPGWKIVLATSHDGGLTWPDLITYQQDEGVVTDYSRMTVNPTTQSILEMIGAEAGGCHVLASRDDGKSADVFAVPATSDGNTPCAAIAASPKGVVVLMGPDTSGSAAALAGQSDTFPIQAARSTDDGKTWLDANTAFNVKGIPQFTESTYRVGSGLELAYDLTNGTHRGTLYATYAAADRDEADVFVRSSPDDGKTWSAPALVNNDTAGTHQWMPNVAVAGDGSVHVFFMDKRYDPAHKFIDITHAVSLDGGKTWANERVSTIPYDGDLGRHQEGFPFIGDYLGVACGPADCWAGFPDASNGATTVIAAAHVSRA